MEEEFRLSAGVVEDQRGPVTADFIENCRDGVASAAARPGRGGVGFQHGNVGVGAGVGLQDRGPGGEKAGEGGGVLHRGGKADAAEVWAQRLQAGDLEDELVAAFGFSEGVNFVDDNPLDTLENPGGIFVAEQEGEAFGRGQQDMRWVGALAAALGVGGVAGAILDPDIQARALDGMTKIAADVGGEGLEGRDVKGMEAGGWICPEL